MADRPRADDWWLASDGRWYPPELHPGASAPTAEAEEGVTAGVARSAEGTAISRGLTYAVTLSLMLTSSLFIVSAFFAFRVADDLRTDGGEVITGLDDLTSNEAAFTGWLAVGILAFVVTGILTIVWTWRASAAFDRRGPTGRRWRGGWTIGAWLIPFANLVLPKLVFNELERLARTPATGDPIGESWSDQPRSTLGDLWWALWVAGVLVNQLSAVLSGDVDATDAEFATALSVNAIGLSLLAAAGIAFLFVLRRIAVDSVTSESLSLPDDRA